MIEQTDCTLGGGRSQRRVGLGPRIIGRPAACGPTAADTLCGLRTPPPSLRARCPLVVPPLCAHCCRLSARLHARLCVALRVASARLCVALRARLSARETAMDDEQLLDGVEGI